MEFPSTKGVSMLFSWAFLNFQKKSLCAHPQRHREGQQALAAVGCSSAEKLVCFLGPLPFLVPRSFLNGRFLGTGRCGQAILKGRTAILVAVTLLHPRHIVS